MGVFVEESDKAHQRRKTEPKENKTWSEEKTINQPNYRGYRAMRSLQGQYKVPCLRGLQEVIFWDYTKSKKERRKYQLRILALSRILIVMFAFRRPSNWGPCRYLRESCAEFRPASVQYK
ncbi:hypothetical protein EDB82DRAFT_501796 [Fusarium venenatum]|uniref:uncharacterized protein n=1 Tax=Fusarium venenatum TaxID=56646 RepID=UPI001D939F8F|nr:hypothetical protein EDB82DRAFT_501796 [Fusarium venenatum]